MAELKFETTTTGLYVRYNDGLGTVEVLSPIFEWDDANAKIMTFMPEQLDDLIAELKHFASVIEAEKETKKPSVPLVDAQPRVQSNPQSLSSGQTTSDLDS